MFSGLGYQVRIGLMIPCPLGVGHGIMRFGGLTRQLSDELKLAVRAKLTASEWSIQTEQAFLVNRIVVWLSTRHPATTSLLDRPLERWMVALRGYLLEQGFLRQPMRRQLSRAQEETRTPLRDPAIVMLRACMPSSSGCFGRGRSYPSLPRTFGMRAEWVSPPARSARTTA